MSVLPIVSVLEYMNLNDLSGVLTALTRKLRRLNMLNVRNTLISWNVFVKFYRGTSFLLVVRVYNINKIKPNLIVTF